MCFWQSHHFLPPSDDERLAEIRLRVRPKIMSVLAKNISSIFVASFIAAILFGPVVMSIIRGGSSVSFARL